MKRMIGILCVCCFLVSMTACGSTGDTTSTDSIPIAATDVETSVDTEAETEEAAAEVETEAPTEEEKEAEAESDGNITIASYSLSTDYNGKDVLVIEYAFTNVEDEATSFTFACKDSVFQNGVECSSMVIGCDDVDTQQKLNDVQPGVTYNLKVGYLLQDMTNAEVVITDLFGTKTILKETIDLGGGEGAIVDVENLQETYVKVAGHRMSQDYNGEAVLIVDYEFYNGSDNAKSFMTSFTAKVFQNGVECDSTVIGCNDYDSEMLMNEIQSGVTATVSKGYHLVDDSEVTIEVKEIFGDNVLVNETLSPQ